MNQINKANDKQSARNISYIWVNRLFLILTPIITTPMITNFFGLETAGIWFLASIFASQLFLLEVGISTSLVRLLANSNIINDRKETIKIITTSFLSLFLISSLLILLIPAITIFFLSAFEI